MRDVRGEEPKVIGRYRDGTFFVDDDSRVLSGEEVLCIDQRHLITERERHRLEVEGLKRHAEFGMSCYQDQCENAYVEYSVAKKLREEVAGLKIELELARRKK